MKITPTDVRHRQFSKSLLGLDEEQVLEFLQIVASEMDGLHQEIHRLKEMVREKDLMVHDMRDRDRTLQSTIQTASSMSDKIRVDAEREAKLIIADAQQKAEIITRDSRDSLKRVYSEITDLKRVRMQFEANLKALVQSHMTLLEQGDKLLPSARLGNMDL